MKSIAVIGHGYVGKAIKEYFKDHFDLVIVDPLGNFTSEKGQAQISQQSDDKEFLEKHMRELANACDLAVICVPTEMREDKSVDTSIVESVLDWLDVPLVLIKSTIPPGTTEAIQAKYPGKKIAFSPEYIGEGKYYVPVHKGYPHPTDMKQHEFFIFGGPRETTSAIIPFFMRVSGPDARYVQTDSRTAELVKYMENSWGAMKVTFANEFFEIAKTFGIDYVEARELWLLDGRVERMHTAVFPDKRGFGGKCFPKDVNGIVEAARRAGYEPGLLAKVLERNDDFRNGYAEKK